MAVLGGGSRGSTAIASFFLQPEDDTIQTSTWMVHMGYIGREWRGHITMPFVCTLTRCMLIGARIIGIAMLACLFAPFYANHYVFRWIPIEIHLLNSSFIRWTANENRCLKGLSNS